jgi:hypothetical protein
MITTTRCGHVHFCGEEYDIRAGEVFAIGREGDLAIDDNPYLHRRFLELQNEGSLWWLANVGSQLTATISDEHGVMQAWLSPAARLPLVFNRTLVWFSAGPTTYELEVILEQAPFTPVATRTPTEFGRTTVGRSDFTPDQMLMVIALCEQALLRGHYGAATLPTSGQAAARLGWTITKFNRKLDNVCQKLARAGVQGLHGGPDGLALNRRARLVEYALSTRLVERTDLTLLDAPDEAD